VETRKLTWVKQFKVRLMRTVRLRGELKLEVRNGPERFKTRKNHSALKESR
jgi:hypothetical protein